MRPEERIDAISTANTHHASTAEFADRLEADFPTRPWSDPDKVAVQGASRGGHWPNPD